MRGFFVLLGLFCALTFAARAEPNEGVKAFYAGHAALQQGDADAAITHFSKALQIGKLDATQVAYVHYYRAIAYQRLDRHLDAVDGYTQALSFNVLPKRVQAALYYNRAIALDHLANFDRAIKDYSSAIALKPDYAEAYMNRGNAYRKLGDNDQALRDYSASASYGNPIKHLPYYGQGLVYEAKGDKESAFKAFQTALMIQPDFQLAKLKVETYQSAGLGIDSSPKSAAQAVQPARVAATKTAGAGTTGATYSATVSAPIPAPPPGVGTSAAIGSTEPSPATPTSPDLEPSAKVSQPVGAMAGAHPESSSHSSTPATAGKDAPQATQAPRKITSIDSDGPVGMGAQTAVPSVDSHAAISSPAPSAHGATAGGPVKPVPHAAAEPETIGPAVAGAPKPATRTGATELWGAAPIQVARAEPPPAHTALPGGRYLIQIAAFKEEAVAQAEAQGIKAKGGELLADVQQVIQRADLGDKGIYYRVQYGPFASKGAAGSRCNELKARGLTCIVVAGRKS